MLNVFFLLKTSVCGRHRRSTLPMGSMPRCGRVCLLPCALIVIICSEFSVAQESAGLSGLCPVADNSTATEERQQQQRASLFLECSFPDFQAATERFSKVLSFKTVSSSSAENAVLYPEEFRALDAYLAQAYAKVGWGRQQGAE